MTEEKSEVSGVVGKIVEWNSKKGYFLGIKGNENDFYGFGAPKAKIDQQVTFEVSPGTGQFADKVKLGKLLKQLGLKEKIKAKAGEEVKEMETLMTKGDKVYFDKQELIVKQCCIKAAAAIMAGTGKVDNYKQWKDAAERVIDMADRFYCYICRGEGPEDKEPEES